MKQFLKLLLMSTLCAVYIFSVSFVCSASGEIKGETEKNTNQSALAEVSFASVSRLNELLKSGVITSQEICKVYIERIENYDKTGIKLNSIISVNKNALEKAKQLDNERKQGKLRGVLHGIPILIKDNIDVQGFATTLGKTSNSDKVAEKNAAVVEKLVKQGAIILGKTNLSTDDIATKYTVSQILGETKNVYNTNYTSGGSSGGSAVAVAASFSPVSIATDTSFSLMYPAALNAVVAFRPTFSLISYEGCAKVNLSRDTVAPVTLSVSDAALIMDVLTDNSSAISYSSSLDKNSLKGKRFAVIKELSQYTYNSPNEFKESDKQIAELFTKATEIIKTQGAEIVTVSVPEIFTYYYTCRESAPNSSAAKEKFLSQVKKIVDEQKIDAFIYPSYLSTPISAGFNQSGEHNSENSAYLNCSGYIAPVLGLPSINVPMGYLSSGVSTGLQIVSLAGKDKEVLSYAYAFEQASSIRKDAQSVPNLYKKGKITINSSVPSSEVSINTSSEQNTDTAGYSWQNICVFLIIFVIILFCIYALLSIFSPKKKTGQNKNRHF